MNGSLLILLIVIFWREFKKLRVVKVLRTSKSFDCVSNVHDIAQRSWPSVLYGGE